MLTEQLLKNHREQLQEDLACILYGLDNEIIENVCQAVDYHFAFLLANLGEVNRHETL